MRTECLDRAPSTDSRSGSRETRDLSVTVELTYDMARELGERRIEIPSARTVADAIRLTKARFPDDPDRFSNLTRVTAVAVNGVLIRYQKGMKTRLRSGDTVSFVKAAAGG